MRNSALTAVILALIALGVPAAVATGQLVARALARGASRRTDLTIGSAVAAMLSLAGFIGAPALALVLSPWEFDPNATTDPRMESVAVAVFEGGIVGGGVCLVLAVGFGIAATRTSREAYGPPPRRISLRLLAIGGPSLAMLALVAVVASFVPVRTDQRAAAAPPPPTWPATSPSATPRTSSAQTAEPTTEPTTGPSATVAAGTAATDQLMAELLAARGPQDPPTAEQLANSAQSTPDATRSTTCPGGKTLTRTVVFTGKDVVGSVTRVLDSLAERGFQLEGTLGADLYLPPADSPLAVVSAGSRNDNAGFITITTDCLRP